MKVVPVTKTKEYIFNNIDLTLQKTYRGSAELFKSSLELKDATQSPSGKFVILFGECVIKNMRYYGKQSSNKEPL